LLLDKLIQLDDIAYPKTIIKDIEIYHYWDSSRYINL